VGGSVYQQAPMRETKRHDKIATVGNDDIWEDDVTEFGHEQEENDLLLNNRHNKKDGKMRPS
jgi:hypothetical protein